MFRLPVGHATADLREVVTATSACGIVRQPTGS
jgi:hypothetical protein